MSRFRPLSLMLRLTLLFGVAAGIVCSTFGWLMTRAIEEHFAQEDLGELEQLTQIAEDALLEAGPAVDGRLPQRFEDLIALHPRSAILVMDVDMNIVHASGVPDDLARSAGIDVFQDGHEFVHLSQTDGKTYRVLLHQVSLPQAGSRPYRVVAALSIGHHQEFLVSFDQSMWLMTGLSVATMSLMGWVAVMQGHAPLREIIARIRQISINALNTGIPSHAVPRELVDLADSFNDMLRRVDDAFRRLSDFNADIAHELRTPVANLMTQTQVVLSRARTLEEYHEILYSNMEEYERMAQMIGDMLFLAQTDNGPIQQNLDSIDLAREVRDLFDYYEGWAEERHVSLCLEGEAGICGDRLMLRRALSNLLSNAIRHTMPGETVRVLLKNAGEAGVLVVVENPGPVIPAEHLPRLFDRFYRVDPSRQRRGEGAGLGLAIVKSIVEAHGGMVSVTSTKGCTRFQLTLPASGA